MGIAVLKQHRNRAIVSRKGCMEIALTSIQPPAFGKGHTANEDKNERMRLCLLACSVAPQTLLAKPKQIWTCQTLKWQMFPRYGASVLQPWLQILMWSLGDPKTSGGGGREGCPSCSGCTYGLRADVRRAEKVQKSSQN